MEDSKREALGWVLVLLVMIAWWFYRREDMGVLLVLFWLVGLSAFGGAVGLAFGDGAAPWFRRTRVTGGLLLCNALAVWILLPGLRWETPDMRVLEGSLTGSSFLVPLLAGLYVLSGGQDKLNNTGRSGIVLRICGGVVAAGGAHATVILPRIVGGVWGIEEWSLAPMFMAACAVTAVLGVYLLAGTPDVLGRRGPRGQGEAALPDVKESEGTLRWRRKLAGVGLLALGVYIPQSWVGRTGEPTLAWRSTVLLACALGLAVFGAGARRLFGDSAPPWFARVRVTGALLVIASLQVANLLPQTGTWFGVFAYGFPFFTGMVLMLAGRGKIKSARRSRIVLQVCGGALAAGSVYAIASAQRMVGYLGLDGQSVDPALWALCAVNAALGVYLLAGFPALGRNAR